MSPGDLVVMVRSSVLYDDVKPQPILGLVVQAGVSRRAQPDDYFDVLIIYEGELNWEWSDCWRLISESQG